MMRRLLSLLLALAMVISFVPPVSAEEPAGTTGANTVTDPVKTETAEGNEASDGETTEASTEESTEASTEESTEASTEETTEPSTEETTEPTTEETTEPTTEETTEPTTEETTELTAKKKYLKLVKRAADGVMVDPSEELVPLDHTHFPSDDFYNKAAALDADQDGYLNMAERKSVQEFDFTDGNFGSLLGLKYFPELVSLQIQNPTVTAVDVSTCTKMRSIEIGYQTGPVNVEQLILGEQPMVTSLTLMSANLKTVDLSGLTGLEQVFIDDSPMLTNVNMGSHKALREMMIQNTGIAAIDLINLPELTKVSLARNHNLSNLKLELLPKLAELNLIETAVAELNLTAFPELSDLMLNAECTWLDVSGTKVVRLQPHTDPDPESKLRSVYAKNCPALQEIYFRNCNNIMTLDLTGSTHLTRLVLGNNFVKTLDFTDCADLTHVELGISEMLESVSLKNCSKLENLEAWGATSLTALDLSDCAALGKLNLCRSGLTGLDVSSCSSLVTLLLSDCSSLGTLTLSGNAKLQELNCCGSALKSLDLSGCSALQSLHCLKSGLEQLTLTGCVSLSVMDASDNALAYVDLTDCTALQDLRINNQKRVLPCTSLDPLNIQDLAPGIDISKMTLNSGTVDPDGTIHFIRNYSGNDIISYQYAVNDQHKFYSNIERTAHPLIYVDLKQATETEDGCLGHFKCSVCGKLYKDVSAQAETSLSELLIPAGQTNIPLTADVFPDPAFLAYLKTSVDDGDGELTQAEIDAVTVLNIPNLHIITLAGIGLFQNLEELDCHGNQIKILTLAANQNLKKLDCRDNHGLETADFGKLTGLTELRFGGNSDLKPQDLSNLKKLQVLDASFIHTKYTHEIMTIFFPELREFICRGSGVTPDISLSETLQKLDLSGNKDTITRMDFGQLPNLTYLNIGSFAALSPDVVAENTKLQELMLTNSKIESINLSNCPDLQKLAIGGTNLHYLDLSACTSQVQVELNGGTNGTAPCNVAPIVLAQGFDLTKVRNIQGGAIQNDGLSFDADSNAITYEYAVQDGNYVTFTLKKDHGNVEKVAAMDPQGQEPGWFAHRECKDCGAWSEDSYQSFAVVPKDSLMIYGTPVIESTETETSPFTDAAFRRYLAENVDKNGNNRLDAEEMMLTYLDLEGLPITSLKGIEVFKKLDSLFISNCPVTELDLSGNLMLRGLSLINTSLTNLDLSGFSEMTNLYISDTPLASLNLQGISEFYKLGLVNTGLSEINLQDCSIIHEMDLRDNQFTALDFSGISIQHLMAREKALTDLKFKPEDILSLDLYQSGLTTLDLSQCSKMDSLTFGNGQPFILDLSSCSLLKYLTLLIPESSFDLNTLGGNFYQGAINITGGSLDGSVFTMDFSEINDVYPNLPYYGGFTAQGKEIKLLKLNDNRLKVSGTTVNLGNSLTMYMNVHKKTLLDQIPTGDYASVNMTHQSADGTLLSSDYMGSLNELGSSVDGNYWQIPTLGLSAKRMTDLYTMDIYMYIPDSYNNPLYVPYTDSVRDYAGRIINNTNNPLNLRRCIVDLLNYGAAAQEFFGYYAEDLANNQLTGEQSALATPSVTPSNNLVAGTNYAGSTLNLMENIQLTAYFENLTPDMYATISYTNWNGAQCDTRVEGTSFIKNGRYYGVRVDTLKIADICQKVTIKVFNSNGEEVGSCVDSMESYCARTQDATKVADAIMKLGISSREYLSGR